MYRVTCKCRWHAYIDYAVSKLKLMQGFSAAYSHGEASSGFEGSSTSDFSSASSGFGAFNYSFFKARSASSVFHALDDPTDLLFTPPTFAAALDTLRGFSEPVLRLLTRVIFFQLGVSSFNLLHSLGCGCLGGLLSLRFGFLGGLLSLGLRFLRGLLSSASLSKLPIHIFCSEVGASDVTTAFRLFTTSSGDLLFQLVAKLSRAHFSHPPLGIFLFPLKTIE